MRGASVHFAPAGALGILIGQVLRSSTSIEKESCLPSGDHVTADGRLFDSGDLRGGAFGVHPAHEDLRALRFALGRERDAVARRRPAGARALGEEAIAAAVGVHDPERRLALVVHLVDPAARVDDLTAVGRELRFGDRLHVEVEIERQAVVLRRARAVLGALRHRHVGAGEKQTDEQQRRRASSFHHQILPRASSRAYKVAKVMDGAYKVVAVGSRRTEGSRLWALGFGKSLQIPVDRLGAQGSCQSLKPRA